MELEFLDIDKRKAWNIIFQEIRNESNNFSYIMQDAKKLENKNLNRYRDVSPFDHSRVRLERGDKDYINASLVNVPSADRSYILTQGPLPVTTGHFWLMVWEQNSKAILMLNRIIEKNTVKCHQYWPVGEENGGSDDLFLPDVHLKVTFMGQKDLSYYIIRNFLLTDLVSLDSREILQFHYVTWPDFGVPESPAAFLNFLFLVRKSGALNSNVGPPVVHCSAGIGRSGTFCLVDSCLVLIEKQNDPNCINVRQQLLEMRHYRMGLIQTPDQLRFSYLAIIEGSKTVLCNNALLHKLTSSYENVIQTDRKSSVSSESSVNESINDTDISPPPLPPRSSRNSEDLSLQTQNVSNINFIEHNEICNLNSSLQSIKNCDLDTAMNCKRNENSRNLDFKLEGNVNSGTEKSNPAVPIGAESASELRKRARKEREEKTAAMVQNIKKKQKESELWEKRRSIIKISLGLVFIFSVGYFVYKKYSKS